MSDEQESVKEAKSEVGVLAKIAKVAEGARSADTMADQMIDNLAANPNLADQLQKTPEAVRDFAEVAKVTTDAATLRNYDIEVAKSNGLLYLVVVICVGLALLLVVVSIAGIAVYQLSLMRDPITNTITVAIPDGLIALGSAAIGALAGLLTPLTGRR